MNPRELDRLVGARHHAPHEILGPHARGRERIVRVFDPDAASVEARWADGSSSLRRIDQRGVFEGPVALSNGTYRIRAVYPNGSVDERYDPYSFAPLLSDEDMYLFGQGDHHRVYEKLGAHVREHEGVAGTHFAVWAPNGQRVSVVGDFNNWDGRRHCMSVRGSSGIWEIFVPAVGEGARYKFEILAQDGRLLLKADPFSFAMELRPGNCSVVTNLDVHSWSDERWISERDSGSMLDRPISIYEVHPGSWRHVGDGRPRSMTWTELADVLIPYVVDMGFTHIELMGVSEHPLDASWGYQVAGYYAATARYGDPAALMQFIDRAHQAGIGVLLDWVPAHFPRDEFALAQFDGTALFEHSDPRQGEHADWGTKIFNYGRNEVRNFLISNALFWLSRFHFDGIRVDAVASMLYLDYSRQPGEWVPNKYGGRENLDAISFLRQLNDTLFRYHPGILSVAEESTAFPGVSRPPYVGGLGFNLKWNMGWMNDTLRYISRDPVYRQHDHNLLTFALMYAFTENFVLPISHDEVVHGKRALLDKMPGDEWQKRANLRLYLAFMFGHPGKKLLFMGSEFGQWREWDVDTSLDWHLLDQPTHVALQDFCRDLNKVYQAQPALYRVDFEPDGFEWIDLSDHANSVYGFMRRARPDDGASPVVFVFNFTPVTRDSYRFGLPVGGQWQVLMNTDASKYGGSGYGSTSELTASDEPWHYRPASIDLDLPPLGALVLTPK